MSYSYPRGAFPTSSPQVTAPGLRAKGSLCFSDVTGTILELSMKPEAELRFRFRRFRRPSLWSLLWCLVKVTVLVIRPAFGCAVPAAASLRSCLLGMCRLLPHCCTSCSMSLVGAESGFRLSLWPEGMEGPPGGRLWRVQAGPAFS